MTSPINSFRPTVAPLSTSSETTRTQTSGTRSSPADQFVSGARTIVFQN